MMSDDVEVGHYGALANYAPGAQVANALVGELVPGARLNAAPEGAGPALMSTAPYKPPRKQRVDEAVEKEYSDPKFCHAPSDKGFPRCRAYHRTGSLYCYAHRGLDGEPPAAP
jgi:hypothetical protein